MNGKESIALLVLQLCSFTVHSSGHQTTIDNSKTAYSWIKKTNQRTELQIFEPVTSSTALIRNKRRGCFCAVYFWAILSSRLQTFIWLVLKGESTKVDNPRRSFLAQPSQRFSGYDKWFLSVTLPTPTENHLKDSILLFSIFWFVMSAPSQPSKAYQTELSTLQVILTDRGTRNMKWPIVLCRQACRDYFVCIQGNLLWHWISPPVSRDKSTEQISIHKRVHKCHSVYVSYHDSYNMNLLPVQSLFSKQKFS